MEDPKIGSVYTYRDKEYVVTNLCTMKDPYTRTWLDAVLYRNTSGHSNKVYVRQKGEFVQRFKLVNNG